MLRTDAKELIVENGKVTGVKAVMYDGTKVTAKARKGVIIATGGYAANVAKVKQTITGNRVTLQRRHRQQTVLL